MAKRKRNIVIRFRVTPEEREMIESKMAQFGTSNMAADIDCLKENQEKIWSAANGILTRLASIR